MYVKKLVQNPCTKVPNCFTVYKRLIFTHPLNHFITACSVSSFPVLLCHLRPGCFPQVQPVSADVFFCWLGFLDWVGGPAASLSVSSIFVHTHPSACAPSKHLSELWRHKFHPEIQQCYTDWGCKIGCTQAQLYGPLPSVTTLSLSSITTFSANHYHLLNST